MFLCWGSFLNVLGYRLVRGQNIAWPRSSCPHCSHVIPWYDLIPVFSWLVLRGSCRFCHRPISALYPFIELITTVVMITLYLTIPHLYFFPYFIFFSALITTIRSDIETMLISRYVTIFLIPLGILLSALGLLPISPLDSVAGALLGFFFLYTMSKLFLVFAGKQGMGQGDLELLAFIGSFLGAVGCWIALLIASVLGSLIGVGYMAITRSSSSTKIPFGPFLAFGAMLYVLAQDYLAPLLIHSY